MAAIARTNTAVTGQTNKWGDVTKKQPNTAAFLGGKCVSGCYNCMILSKSLAAIIAFSSG